MSKRYNEYYRGYQEESHSRTKKPKTENFEETSTEGYLPTIPTEPDMSTSYRKYKKRSSYPKKLSYPRGVNKMGQYRSRGPYRINSTMKPELKSVDIEYPPIPFSYSIHAGTLKWTAGLATADPYQTYIGTNNGGVLIGSTADATQPAPIADIVFAGGLLYRIKQGMDIKNRVGNKILVKSIYFQATVRSPPSKGITNLPDGNQSPIGYRILLTKDKQPNGSIPAISDILQEVYHIDNRYVQPNSPNNLDNRDRFTTLFDIKDTMSPQGNECRMFEKFQKLNNFSTTFNSNGGVNTNDLYLIFLSDGIVGNMLTNAGASVAVDTRPYIKFTARIRYTDC